MIYQNLVTLIVCSLYSNYVLAATDQTFPAEFKFGVATSSYQVEGGWNDDGKGENVWDHICHTDPEFIMNEDNGDIACDSYHKYKEDVALITDLGADFYRFSISWSRILPYGSVDVINQAGVDYYRNLIAELKANGIEPYVTIHHWDLPQPLQDLGGWTSPDMVEYYANYARLLFTLYGDYVKTWITFNEPMEVCVGGYGSTAYPPRLNQIGVLDYECAYTIIKAHARAYHIYDEEFRKTQKGRISITLDDTWYEPATDSLLDKIASERILQFTIGLYAHPIIHGNFPPVVIERVAIRSFFEGYEKSRLPTFTLKEILYIRGTYDFLGINHYSTSYASWQFDDPIGNASIYHDISVNVTDDSNWEQASLPWLKVVPWGMRHFLNWLHQTYNGVEIIITENGYSDITGNLTDDRRINYYKEYLSNLLLAKLEDGVNVSAFTAWSLMDNLEWTYGFTQKFGLYYVDFNDPDRPRVPKASAEYYKKVISTRCLVDECEG